MKARAVHKQAREREERRASIMACEIAEEQETLRMYREVNDREARAREEAKARKLEAEKQAKEKAAFDALTPSENAWLAALAWEKEQKTELRKCETRIKDLELDIEFFQELMEEPANANRELSWQGNAGTISKPTERKREAGATGGDRRSS